MFKTKKYTLVITFADNTETTHKSVSRIKQKGDVITFRKGAAVLTLNWDKIYGIAVRPE